MKTLSRHMPKEILQETPLVGKAILALIIFGLIWLCVKHPISILMIAVVAILFGISRKVEERRLSKIATQRQDESICTFARSFDCHEIDSWIIRATYEEIQKYLDSEKFPLKASDRIDEDLRIDREDLDDIAYIIAKRAGYSMEDTEANPYFDKIETVEDVVMFFHNQLKIRSNQNLHSITASGGSERG